MTDGATTEVGTGRDGSAPFGPANGSLPRGPWVASRQYSMKFILSADNEILWRCDWLPMKTLCAMVKAANDQMAANDQAEAPDK